ncbi:MAG: ATP-binding cassette domain-containing protein [Saprospiraceae bacterium]|nr:ATP-binding cassette domain-containing protein [Saprospiraceae bacterium]
MLSTKSLQYQYDDGHSFSFPDLVCGKKEKLLVLGSSGVGKSTLLHLLGGLLNAQKGSIVLGTKDLAQMKHAELDKFRGDHIGIVFQKNHFIASLSVLENLLMAQFFGGKNEDQAKCMNLLERLNIQGKANKSIRTLSEGEKQRVAIARALVNNPSLILADEPTSALDDKNCDEVIHLLEEQANIAEAALVIVTHDTRLKDKVSNQITLV